MTNGESKVPDPLSLVAQLKFAEAKLREFIVDWPLYRRLEVDITEPRKFIDFPSAVAMPCSDDACKNQPTTTWKREPSARSDADPGNLLIYSCVHCGRAKRYYWVVTWTGSPVFKQAPTITGTTARGPLDGFLVFYFLKVGQYPAGNIEPPKEVKRAMDEATLEIYKKGLVCMSVSYGIGALGYFRRVVENAVSDLLNLVEEAATTDKDEQALEAVRAARESKVADEKLRLIANVVPVSLRPGGVNPFARLHDDYSRGIHALSDEECLEIASNMRDALEYVFGNIRDKLDQARAFRERIAKRTR